MVSSAGLRLTICLIFGQLFSSILTDISGGKFTHVGQYAVDSKDKTINGSTHKDHQHMHDTIVNAVKGLHYHSKAVAFR